VYPEIIRMQFFRCDFLALVKYFSNVINDSHIKIRRRMMYTLF